jgi:LysM repeat protein
LKTYTKYLILNLTRKCTIFLFLTIASTTFAQNNRFFSLENDIVVDILAGNELFYIHQMDKGTSIYSLAEIFQVDVQTILQKNGLKSQQSIPEGKNVLVPINRENLIIKADFNPKHQASLPLYYEVKKGESLYRISKTYFGTDVNIIQKLNKKSSESIAVGEKLLVGYLSLSRYKKVSNDIRPKNQKTISKDIVLHEPKVKVVTDQKQHERADTTTLDTKVIKWYNSNVIALWDKNSESTSLFVLHNEARLGSTMDIYFPMLKRQVKAKVLGRIPEGTYRDDISLFVSPGVARELGIRDSRFMVNIKYEVL